MESDLFLMSPPGAGFRLRGRANFRSAVAPDVDAVRARREWELLRAAIEDCGGRVRVLPPDDAWTGLPFAAEAGQPTAGTEAGSPPRFLIPRMASAHRRGEAALWSAFVTQLGFDVVTLGEGVWEAQGDVAEFRGTTLLFYGGRTDYAGLRAARGHLGGDLLEIEIRDPAFHGNMALLPLPAADRVLVCPEVLVEPGMQLLAHRFGAERLIPVTESEIRQYATNGLPIADSWIAPSVVPARVLRLVGELGLRVRSIVMSELCEKAGGASRCLVCRIPADLARGLA